MFLGYSRNSKAYRVFNKKTKTMLELMNVMFDDTESLDRQLVDEDSDITPLSLREQQGPIVVNDTSLSQSSSDSSSGSSEDRDCEDHQQTSHAESQSRLIVDSPHAKLYKNGHPSWI